MIDTLLQCALSNTAIALLLTLIAVIVGTRTNQTRLANGLWLLVLIKLITPPIWNVPLEICLPEKQMVQRISSPNNGELRQPIVNPKESAAEAALTKSPLAVQTPPRFSWKLLNTGLIASWLAGICVIVVTSFWRVIRFKRLLNSSGLTATHEVRSITKDLACDMGIETMPILTVTAARVSPFVWWLGGRVQIVLPQKLIDELDSTQLRCVIAHELAHVRRKDYMVRWIEWFANACCWWNPISWVARRNLRATEEVCCDSLAMNCLGLDSHSYANAIVSALESVALPDFFPPVMASEINSGGFMKQRITKIMSNTNEYSGNHFGRQTLRNLLLFAIAIAILPLGLLHAQETKETHEKVGKRLMKSVKEGEITQLQFDAMMKVLKDTGPAKDTEQSKETVDWKKIRELASHRAILLSSFNRMNDTLTELQHFERLEDAGVATLDVALDAQRRRFQSGVAFNTALSKFTLAHAKLKRHVQTAIEDGEIPRGLAVEKFAAIDAEVEKVRSALEPLDIPMTVKDLVWLARQNVEVLTKARTEALETWRIVKKEFGDGAADTNLQKVAQAAEQYHFFEAQLMDAQNTLMNRKLQAK